MSALFHEAETEAVRQDIEVFASRFAVEGPSVTPRSSYDMRNDDTGTFRRDTEDYDT
jgi:hypothetical protein